MEGVLVRTIDGYWHDFVLTGLEKRKTLPDIREELIEAFQNEMFSLLLTRSKAPALACIDETPKNINIAKNVGKEARRKWLGLVRRCNKYKQTWGMLQPDDWKEGISMPGDKPEEQGE